MGFITKNIKLHPKKNYNSWDKVSVGSWKVNGDSQVYAEIKLEADHALKYIQKKSESSANKITITHFLGKVMGKVLKENPGMNVVIRLNKIFMREEVNIFFQVADGDDLSGHCIKNIDEKSINEIAEELTDTALNIRNNTDPSFKQIKDFWRFIPIQFSGVILGFIRFLMYGLNLNIKFLGIPLDSFGGLMITNIGSLGFDNAFVPLPPFSHVPFIIALGKIKYEPVSDEDGTVCSKKMVSLCVTFDHRVVDGYVGAKISSSLKKYFDNPELLD